MAAFERVLQANLVVFEGLMIGRKERDESNLLIRVKIYLVFFFTMLLLMSSMRLQLNRYVWLRKSRVYKSGNIQIENTLNL